MNSPSSISVLIVGAGSIGERHVRCFQQTGRADVTLCEPNASVRAAVADRYQVESFAGLDEALQAKTFDGAVLCIPAHLHIPMAKAALAAGVSVLIEKPLGTSLDGASELLQLRDERKLAAGVAYVMRFVPSIQQARDFLKTGELGNPLHVTVVSGQHFPTFRPAYRDIYYAQHKSGGGAIQDALTHSANSVEWLIGPTDSLFCDAAHQALEGVEVEDTVNLLARNGGTLVNYALNQFQAPNETTHWIHCEKGSLKIEFHNQRWGVLRHGEKSWFWRNTPVEHRDSLFIAQANAFLDAMERKETGLCSLEEGIQTLEFNLAALESARTGQKMKLQTLNLEH